MITVALDDNVLMSEIEDISSSPANIYQYATFEDLTNSDIIHDSICEGWICFNVFRTLEILKGHVVNIGH